MLGGGARGLQHFTEMVGGDMHITINWKGTADKLIETDLPVVYRMDTPAPQYVIDELLDKVPDFRKAYNEDGLSIDEFEDYGPVLLFRSMFLKGWENLLQVIKEQRKSVSIHKHLRREDVCMSSQKMGVAEFENVQAVEMKPGIVRRTLVYNDEMMLCHFTVAQGMTLDLHQHVAVQSGYVITGKLKFIKADGTSFIATAGTAYLFDSNEVHGIGEVYEASEVIECFAPSRPEYM